MVVLPSRESTRQNDVHAKQSFAILWEKMYIRYIYYNNGILTSATCAC